MEPALFGCLSNRSDEVAGNYYDSLLTIGAWLARHYPRVYSPQQWTVELAKAWVDAVESQPNHEWVNLSQRNRSNRLPGKPKRAKVKQKL
jgi:hypothetical protein